MPTRQTADQPDDTRQLLALVARLHEAVATRDLERVRDLLDGAGAMRLPREVREEALAIAALSPSSYRVPMALLRFHHRLTQLADVGDADADAEAVQMEIPFVRDRQRRNAVHAARGSHGPPRDRV